jgi:hydroxyacylglutathione hydrolase
VEWHHGTKGTALKIQRFEVPGLAQYSYVISDSGEAAVIDPIRDIGRYLAYAEQENVAIAYLLETHIHADFAAGSIALEQATGAELALSAYDEGERYRYAMPHRALHDGDAIQFGQVRLEALHTPGHTPEHLSFLLYDLSRSELEPVALFSGDFLFVGSLGRPDLLGQEAKLGLAHDLYRSVSQRIASLPDALEIYPGHGAGSLCGSGMGAHSQTTLGYERANNPFFQYAEDEFVERILASVPPLPDYYPRMKELNAQGAPAWEEHQGSSAIMPAQGYDLIANGHGVALDLRGYEAYGNAHIAGSINIGSGQNLPLWAGWLLQPDQPILLVTEDGSDDVEARRALGRVGLDRVAGHVAGGIAAWVQAGLPVARTAQKTAAEVEQERDNAVLLDVRMEDEWSQGHISGSQHLMLGDLPASFDQLSKESPIITVCGSGYRASVAASLLERAGFKAVSSLDGGIAAWQQQGLPLTT